MVTVMDQADSGTGAHSETDAHARASREPSSVGAWRPATMADVADRVGVSRQLVGLVFRDQAGVSAATKQRILDAAAELGYVPNTAARSLRSPSTKSIGVSFDPSESAPADIVHWLHDVAKAAGYRLIVSTRTRSEDDVAAVAELVGYRCEAVILIAPRSEPSALLAAAGRTPVVVIGRQLDGAEFDVVRSRGDAGVADLVDYLFGLGHRSIAFVNASGMLDSHIRLAGYSSAVDRLGLASEVLEVTGDYTEESGARAAEVLLALPRLPTAVMCNNDQAALGLAHRLRQAGIRIPDDVSITGFDDSRIARLSFMDLTTVRQDPREVAEATIAQVVARIASPDAPVIEHLTSAQVVLRGSTRAPLDE
jgi:DNA-binding LacI/PurR family transcriptional regulator